jgi:hypothetical protein
MKKSIFLLLIFCTLACRKSRSEFSVPESSTYPYSRFEQDYYYWESIPSNKKPPLPKVHLVGLKDKNNQQATGEYEINYRLISPYQETNWHQEKRELKDGTLILAIDIHAFLDREKLWAFGGTQRLLFEFVVQNKQGQIEQIHIPLFIDTYRHNPDPYLLIKSLTKYEQNPEILGIEIACAKFNHFSNDNTPEIQVQFNSQETFTTVKFEVDEQKNTCFLNVNIPKNVPFDENLRILLWQDFRPENKIVTLVNTWTGNKHKILPHKYCVSPSILLAKKPFKYLDKIIKNSQGEVLEIHNFRDEVLDSFMSPISQSPLMTDEEIIGVLPSGENLWECFQGYYEF